MGQTFFDRLILSYSFCNVTYSLPVEEISTLCSAASSIISRFTTPVSEVKRLTSPTVCQPLFPMQPVLIIRIPFQNVRALKGHLYFATSPVASFVSANKRHFSLTFSIFWNFFFPFFLSGQATTPLNEQSPDSLFLGKNTMYITGRVELG